jgi:hypothetical protein
MYPRHLLPVLAVFAILLPAAPKASATPPDKPNAAPPSPAKTETPRPAENKPTTEAQAYAVVEKDLVKPLSQKEGRGSRFSRAYIPPQARRVRIDHERSTDGRGGEFLAFAIDERSAMLVHRAADDSDDWRKDAIVGCVYPAQGEIFIKRGDKFFGASLLLGKRTAADDTVCRPAPARIPSSAPST